MAYPQTPLEWVQRLHKQLNARQADNELFRRYADGRHDDPTVETQVSAAFRRIMGLSKTNLTGLIIQSTAERCQVMGFRFGDEPDSDKDAARMWQNSDFDAESELLITSALTVGRSFVLVEPPRAGEELPRLYAEDASQVIVAYAPGRRNERIAALKVWSDEWSDDLFATLYLPGSLHKFHADRPASGSTANPPWELRDPDVAGERNPLGEVPFFELRNRPRLDGSVRSEISDVLADQDACNHIALNALIAAEYGAFRQKWATGLEVPRIQDPRYPDDPTKQIPVQPFDIAVNRILISENDEATFGDFNPTDLNPYIALYESRARHMAAVSETPVSVLLGAQSNVAAEALALSVSGHVNKCRRRMTHYEDPFEGAVRLGFKAIGDPRANAVSAETIWKDPEIRSRAQEADAAVKLVQGGVIPPQQAQEDLGYTDTQRERMRAWTRENGPPTTSGARPVDSP